MYQDILVPTDGSPGAEAAVGYALDLARAAGGTVHALHVARPPAAPEMFPPDALTVARKAAVTDGEAAATRVADRAAEAEVDAAWEVREGTPYRAILEYAREADVDLVVMSSHGRTGPDRARLGSTTERVVGNGVLPVLVVPAAGDGEPAVEPGGYDEVVVAVDGSTVGERAADHALDLAAEYGAGVHAVYVVDAASRDLEGLPRSIVGMLKEGGRTAVEAVAAGARERDLAVSTRILRGLPEEAILRYAAGADADLLAMGARGRTAPEDRFLGSTTARVLRRSEIPVLAVN